MFLTQSFFLLQNPVLFVIHKESVLGRLHWFRRVIWEQYLLSCQSYATILNSGKASSSKLVASFAACSALTVRCSSVPNKQQPCASQRLPPRHPVTMLNVMASQCVCLDMLLLPIVNVLLKKCCSVSLDYSFAALLNFCNFCNFCNLCFAKFRKLLSHGRVTQGLQI